MALKIDLLQLKERGRIAEVKQDIVHVHGLSNCMNGQLVRFGRDTEGVVVGFDEDYALALIVKEGSPIKPGDEVTSTIDAFTVPVGEEFIGRHVNALCMPIDGKGPIKESRQAPIFAVAPSVLERVPVTESMTTGTKLVDMMTPIGRGQRELIIGDRMTGKTTIATDAMISQKGAGVVCIYCCIGKSEASLNRVLEIIENRNIWEYGIVISATAADSMGKQYLVPYVASSLAEYFMNQLGGDVLIVFDDLTKHAWNYRQISLLLERSPGRDAYPGDIFYVHSQLVERAGKMSPENGGGSITHLPIVETIQGDVTGYIPSNTISMTDGQIYMSTQLFGEGFKPAIDTGLSVSRIGSKVQWPAIKKLSGMLRLEYVQYKELEKLTRIKAGVSEEVQKRLTRGQIVAEVLKQDADNPIPMLDQVIWLFGFREGYMDDTAPAQVRECMENFLARLRASGKSTLDKLEEVKDITDEIQEELDEHFRRLWDSNP
jgi:F-type H+-transporting ATPase subunit alpha